MKSIKLYYTDSVNNIFNSIGSNYPKSYYLKVIGDQEHTFFDTNSANESEIMGNQLEINLGFKYQIDLTEFNENEIILDFREEIGLGSILFINESPYFLKMKNNNFNLIDLKFSTLKIIDFEGNDYLEDLSCISFCSDLRILNINSCKNLKDISILPSFNFLYILYLDSFNINFQFDYICKCHNLKLLSQNSCKFYNLNHLEGLSKLEKYSSKNNSLLGNLSGFKGLNSLIELDLSGCRELFDINPISYLSGLNKLNLSNTKISNLSFLNELSRLQELNINKCIRINSLHELNLLNLTDLNASDCTILESLQFRLPELLNLDLSGCVNLKNLLCLDFSSKLETLNLSRCKSLFDISDLKGFIQLKSLKMNECLSLTDLTDLNGMFNLSELELFFCKKVYSLPSGLTGLRYVHCVGCEKLADLNPLNDCVNIIEADFSGCLSLEYLSPLRNLNKLNLSKCVRINEFSLEEINGLNNLTNLNLTRCISIYHLNQLRGMSSLTCLILHGCSSLRSLDLSGTSISVLDLTDCTSFVDVQGLNGMAELTILNFSGCTKLRDLSPLSNLTKLKKLILKRCYNLETLPRGLTGIKTLELRDKYNLKDLSALNDLTGLTSLHLQGSNHITVLPKNLIGLTSFILCDQYDLQDLSPLSSMCGLTSLVLSRCIILSDLSPLSSLTDLLDLDLSGCSSIQDLSPLDTCKNLKSLNLNGCVNLIFISPLKGLSNLESLNLSNSPNIRDLDSISSLENLKELAWIDKISCSEILVSCAYIRKDLNFITESLENWAYEIILSKKPNNFIFRILDALTLISPYRREKFLDIVGQKMRERAFQSTNFNEVTNEAWEKWCGLVAELSIDSIFNSFEFVTDGIDNDYKTENILGQVIVTCSDLIVKFPEQKGRFIEWVDSKLNRLSQNQLLERLIAPFAAVFFAALQREEVVKKWLLIATDEDYPIWLEKVKTALIRYYSRKKIFGKAQELLDSLEIQEEKDISIGILAENMADSYPLESAFLLDSIKNPRLSEKTAKIILQNPGILNHPQGIYQLLLHLQSSPSDLTECLEALIEGDLSGKSADILRKIFLEGKYHSYSAAIFFYFCDFYKGAIIDLVSKNAFESYQSKLREKLQIEMTKARKDFINELIENEVLHANHANKLENLLTI